MFVIEDVENTETYEGGHQMLTGPSTWRGQLLPLFPGHRQVPPGPLRGGTLPQHVQNQLESDPVLGLPALLSGSQGPGGLAHASFCVLLSSPLSLCHSICVLYRPSLWTTSYFVFYIVYLGLVCLSQWNVSSVKHEGHVTKVTLGLASAWNIVGA